MASIRVHAKRDGTPSFYVLWREPVTGRQRSITYTDHQEARNFAAILEANGNHLGRAASMIAAIKSKSPAVAIVTAEHIDGLSGVLDRTRADYRRDAANHITPHLGHLPVDELTAARVRNWVRTLAGTDIADKTLANVHGLLSAVMTYAVEVGYRIDNPCRGVALPRRDAEHENFAFTREQWQAMDAQLGEYVGGWYQPLYRFLIATGMRWGEATALQVRDLTLTGDTPTVRVSKAVKRDENSHAYVGVTKTRRSRRDVSLPATTVEQLAAQVQGKRTTDLVFPAPRGGVVLASNARARVWTPAVSVLKARGVLDPGSNPVQHDLRHTWATWAIAGGVDMLTVQHTLGHESIQTTTQTYATVMPVQHRSAAAAIDAMLRG